MDTRFLGGRIRKGTEDSPSSPVPKWSVSHFCFLMGYHPAPATALPLQELIFWFFIVPASGASPNGLLDYTQHPSLSSGLHNAPCCTELVKSYVFNLAMAACIPQYIWSRDKTTKYKDGRPKKSFTKCKEVQSCFSWNCKRTKKIIFLGFDWSCVIQPIDIIPATQLLIQLLKAKAKSFKFAN